MRRYRHVHRGFLRRADPGAAAAGLAAAGRAAAGLRGRRRGVRTAGYPGRWLERRSVTELGRRNLVSRLSLGVVLGVVLFAVTLALIASDAYRLRGGGSVGHLLATLGLMAGAATCEELLFRGCCSGSSSSGPVPSSP